MTPAADQVAAFQANAGFAPSAVSTVVLGVVFAVLLLWGVWAMRSAYVGWVESRINHRQFLGVVVRFAAMYLVSDFINPAAFDAAGIPDHRVANPRHSGAMAVVCALCSGRQQPLGANADL